MRIAVDTTFLSLLLDPAAAAATDPDSRLPVPYLAQRLDYFLDRVTKPGATLYIPAATLAEALSRSEQAVHAVETLLREASVEIAPFDARAAYALGHLLRAAKAAGDKRSGDPRPWQHVKMDRVVAATAVALQVDAFYCDDHQQAAFARSIGLAVVSSWQLPLPANYAQQSLADLAPEDWPPKPPPKPLRRR